jgi:hypothetical protein
MSMLRPEVSALLTRWREVIAAGCTALVGVWLTALGGYFLVAIGVVMILIAAAWGLIALRRLQFFRDVSAPGIVEVDEGQLGYFGPSFGGVLALDDLVELRLSDLHNTRQWRLKTRAGEVLLIPTTATGAEKLFDAFATLPGIDMTAVTVALNRGAATLPIWQRPGIAPIHKQLDHELS